MRKGTPAFAGHTLHNDAIGENLNAHRRNRGTKKRPMTKTRLLRQTYGEL
jgi:hypothetical protein